MAQTKIEWSEKVWNPLAGCSKVSSGCKNCYAIRMAHRLEGSDQPEVAKKYKGLTVKQKNGELNWTGKINFDDKTLRMKFPKRATIYFVNSMSDLFHPKVPFKFIDSVYEVMGYHTQHIFQILTKHPERALEYYKWTNIFKAWSNWDHLWLGTSVENQIEADRRREDFMNIPHCKIKFVSYEPALENINWKGWGFIDWLICGGESGPKSRAMHPNWARNTRDFCIKNNIKFFFKQWGSYLHRDQMRLMDHSVGKYYNAEYVKGGKKELGRMLDGRIWDEYPKGITR